MKNKGFTLVELIVVIAILAVAVTVAIPVISSVTGKAGMNADRITAEQIETCIDTWMNTDYWNQNFFRTNLYTSASSATGVAGRINGCTEQIYSYYFAGTGQLPGVECKTEQEIRHSVITAIKATSNMHMNLQDGEQFVEGPRAGARYGYKYYYKIGRVNVENVDSSSSTLGSDDVYQYYVWLDRVGGNISSEIVGKHYKSYPYLYVRTEKLYSMKFEFGTKDVGNIRIEIEKDGQTYTMLAGSETPTMFKPGIYDLRFYYNGDLYKTIQKYDLNTENNEISAE